MFIELSEATVRFKDEDTWTARKDSFNVAVEMRVEGRDPEYAQVVLQIITGKLKDAIEATRQKMLEEKRTE